MIQYALKCENGHRFDSWFHNAEAFDKLRAAGLATCAVCGSSKVEKAVMAPRVQSSKDQAENRPLSAPQSPGEQALADMRKTVEENSEYVGSDFAKEARAMHDGDAPERAIYGEAKVQDAKSLIDDGVPVVPLPFGPSRKTN